MIHFLHPNRHHYTDRTYLTRWFLNNTLVITDNDINDDRIDNNEITLEEMVENHWCKNILVDLSHNAMPLTDIPDFLRDKPTLTYDWNVWYQPTASNVHFFPLWFYMFSLRTNQWYEPLVFDVHGRKTLPMICFNRNEHPHRIRFGELITSIRPYILYTLGPQILPGDAVEEITNKAFLDVSIKHPAYEQCAVNIVTETVMDRSSLSEKSCKPFVARQIPVIVGPKGSNRFLTDIGFDMFGDLVPWYIWDDESNEDQRLQKIASFVIAWVQSGTILEDYRRVQSRVERNKQYFHSEKFRDLILRNMPSVDPFSPER